jgi:hypothetical protein
MGDCPDSLKPSKSGLGICTSEVCFDANFSCLNIPLGANLSQVLSLMDAALCNALNYDGVIPNCLTVGANPTIQDVLELVAAEVCYSPAIPSCLTVGADPTISDVVDAIATLLCAPVLPAVSYVYSDIQIVDFTWQVTDTLVPGMSHVVASATGNYTVRVDLLNSYTDSSNGTIKIFVDAVEVASWGPILQTHTITEFYASDGFTWRGAVTLGQTITVKTIKTGDGVISSKKFSWLINKS